MYNAFRNKMTAFFFHNFGISSYELISKVEGKEEIYRKNEKIAVLIEDEEIGIVIELKYAENAAFDTACQEAMNQIRDRNYEEKLIDDGMKTIYRYGIACYKKRCKVVSG